MDDLKQEFIAAALRKYNEEVIKAMRIMAQRMNIGVTGDGIDSLAYTLAGKTVSNLSFREYLRFVDMGVGKGRPLGKLSTTRVELKSRKQAGQMFIKDRSRRAKKFYSRTAYGKLSMLQGTLLYGYTEEARAALKKELEAANNTEVSS